MDPALKGAAEFKTGSNAKADYDRSWMKASDWHSSGTFKPLASILLALKDLLTYKFYDRYRFLLACSKRLVVPMLDA